MASAEDAKRRIKNAPLRLYGVIRAVSTLLPITGGLTGSDAEISADGAAFADIAAAESELGTTGFFRCDLAATETAYDHVYFQFKATNSGAVTYIEHIEFESSLESGVAQSASSTTIVLRAAASSTAGLFVPGVIEIVRGTGAGQFRGIVAYNGSQQVTVDRAWTTTPDSTSVYTITPQPHGIFDSAGLQQSNAVQINSSATAAANMAHAWASVIYDTMTGTPSTTQFAGGGTATLNSSTNNFYLNSIIIFESGACAGLARRVSAYTAATNLFTLDAALPTAPSAADQYQIISYQA